MPWTAQTPLVNAPMNILTAAQQGLELGQEEEQVKEQKALREIFAKADTSTPEGQADLIRQVQRVSPQAAMQLQAQQQKAKESQATIAKEGAQTKEAQAKTGQIETDIFSDYQNYWASNIKDISGRAKASAGTALPGTPTYDAAVKRANEEIDKAAGTAREKYGSNEKILQNLQEVDKQDYTSLAELEQDAQRMSARGQQQKQAQVAEPPFVKELQAAYPNWQTTQAKEYNAALQKRIARETAPPAAQANITLMAPKGDLEKTGDEYLKSLPESDRSVVKAIAEGRMDPTKLSTRGGERERLMKEVTAYDPTYTQSRVANYREFTVGKTANNITAINTAIGHIGTLDKLSDALNNKDTKAINSVINTVKSQTGNASVNNFETARDAVGNELMRVFRQVGASENETKEWEARFSAANSPAQLKGAIKTATELLHSRIDALQDQWHRGSGSDKDFPNLLSSKSKEVLERVEKPSDANPQAYEDPDKEARYQAWKKAHGG